MNCFIDKGEGENLANRSTCFGIPTIRLFFNRYCANFIFPQGWITSYYKCQWGHSALSYELQPCRRKRTSQNSVTRYAFSGFRYGDIIKLRIPLMILRVWSSVYHPWTWNQFHFSSKQLDLCAAILLTEKVMRWPLNSTNEARDKLDFVGGVYDVYVTAAGQSLVNLAHKTTSKE